MAKIGVAVHGAGWVSSEHLKAYQNNPNVEVLGMASRTAASASARLNEAGLQGARVYRSYDEILSDPAVQAISLCTPPHLHPEETIAAARAGKHVLIEKSVANDRESLHAMQKAVRAAGVKTVVSFVLHWNPEFIWIRDTLDRSSIGDVFYAEVDYWHNIGPHYKQYEWNIKRAIAGNAWLSAGCHAVDAIRWFVGREVIEVSAISNRRNDGYEYDTNAIGLLKFEGGVIGKVSVSFDVQSPYAFNIDLLGDKGTIRDNRIYSRSTYPGSTDWVTVPTIRPDSGDVTHHPFQGEIDHFIDCITTDSSSPLDLDDAAKTHEICYALEEAAGSGATVRVGALES